MDTNIYVKDLSALEEIRKLDYYKTFSDYDEEGKLEIIELVYRRCVTGKKLSQFTSEISDIEKFAELLPKAVSENGLLALIGICQGQNRITRNRGYTLRDMLNEAEKLADKNANKNYPWYMYRSYLNTLDQSERNEFYKNREFAN